MSERLRETIDFLKEVGWAILVIDLFVALGALVLRPHIGSTAAFWIFVGFTLLVVALLGGIAMLNVLIVWMYGWHTRAKRRRRARSP